MVAEAHAWGITTHDFLSLFLAVGALHLAAGVVLYWLCLGPRDRDRGVHVAPAVDVYELAVLNGSLVLTVAADLHQSGRLELADGRLVVCGQLEGDIAPIERELLRVAAQNPGSHADRFGREPTFERKLRHGPAYMRITAAMSEKGLLPARWMASSLRRIRRLGCAYIPVGLIGLVVVIDPTPLRGTELIAEMSFSLGVTLVTLFFSFAPRDGSTSLTRRGRSVLDHHRERHRHLSSGPIEDRDLTLAVALFGSCRLQESYPLFAHAWGFIAPREDNEDWLVPM